MSWLLGPVASRYHAVTFPFTSVTTHAFAPALQLVLVTLSVFTPSFNVMLTGFVLQRTLTGVVEHEPGDPVHSELPTCIVAVTEFVDVYGLPAPGAAQSGLGLVAHWNSLKPFPAYE